MRYITKVFKAVERREARSYHQEGRASMDKAILNKTLAYFKRQNAKKTLINDENRSDNE